MVGEEDLPAAGRIKVKDGKVLWKQFPLRYRVVGPLAGARADIDQIRNVRTPSYLLEVLVPPGISCLYVIGSDIGEMEWARAWADRFNELARQAAG